MNHIVFTFPGQGGYRYSVIRELYVTFPVFQYLFQKADAITVEKLGCSFLPLVQAEDKHAHDAYLTQFPDLDQVGIYLTNILVAKLHLQNGIEPELLLGHSFGEISALAIAGAFTEEEGLSIVCDRILALQYSRNSGNMAALSCSVNATEQLLKACGKNIQIAVQNHKKQTIVAGAGNDIAELKIMAASQGISLSLIDSRYPFHSSYLSPSVLPFYESLKLYEFKQTRVPVYLCTEHKLYEPHLDMASILSNEFIKQFSFSKIIDILHHCGFQNFIECGSGELISNLIRKNIPQPSAIGLYPTIKKGSSLTDGLAELYDRIVIANNALNANEPADAAYWDKERVDEMPVAIIAMGSVLPGSVGVEQLWKNISEGVNSIVDLGATMPRLKEDILGGTQENPMPDKTYTLLRGSVEDVPWNADWYSKYYNKQQFEERSVAEKMLAHVVAECIAGVNGHHELDGSRIKCFIGSTEEGIKELSYTMFLEALEREMLAIDPTIPDSQMGELFDISENKVFRSQDLHQYDLCGRVIRHMLQKDVETLVVDSACSSGAYATYMAARALIDNECDLVMAGGLYAPALGSYATFAQFKGLTPTDATPFDAKADGVVFADGATLIAMKRLSDAVADGDKIIGVLRGIGLSSDGRSASINVPRTPGQKLAIERGLAKAGVSIDTIQYIEAHATATPVGDAIEANSIKEITAGRDRSLPPVELGGIKALIGHTGWTASTASLLKVLKAFEENTVPKQTKFFTPNKRIKPEESGLNIAVENKAWKVNSYSLPKRAGINSFGFGGTNSHTVVESYEAGYHAQLLKTIKPPKAADTNLVIIGTGFLYPGSDTLVQEVPGNVRTFDRNKMELPAGKVLLPDVKDVMDPSQFLSSLCAEKILKGVDGKWQELRDRIGVVIGIQEGIERSVWMRERLICDQLKRQASANMQYAHADTLLQAIDSLKQRRPVTTPYSLPGLLPNITASRISFLFDLHGPNMIVDGGGNSLLHAIEASARLLRSGDSDMVLTGGMNCYNEPQGNEAEAACMIGLTTVEIARKYGMSVICEIDIVNQAAYCGDDRVGISGINYKGASRGAELQLAIAEASKTGNVVTMVKNAAYNFTLLSPRSGVRCKGELVAELN